MLSTLERPDVGRKRKTSGHGGERPGAGRPKGPRDDLAVKIERAIATKAKIVASAQGITMAEYLSDVLRNIVDRDFLREMKRIDRPDDIQ